MTSEILQTESLRELDHRAGDGLDVFLLWDPVEDRVMVVVNDARTGDLFDLAVPADKALDAFHHPFAYAAAGVDFTSLARESACAETTTVL
jgi:hypothetical protein